MTLTVCDPEKEIIGYAVLNDRSGQFNSFSVTDQVLGKNSPSLLKASTLPSEPYVYLFVSRALEKRAKRTLYDLYVLSKIYNKKIPF